MLVKQATNPFSKISQIRLNLNQSSQVVMEKHSN